MKMQRECIYILASIFRSLKACSGHNGQCANGGGPKESENTHNSILTKKRKMCHDNLYRCDLRVYKWKGLHRCKDWVTYFESRSAFREKAYCVGLYLHAGTSIRNSVHFTSFPPLLAIKGYQIGENTGLPKSVADSRKYIRVDLTFDTTRILNLKHHITVMQNIQD